MQRFTPTNLLIGIAAAAETDNHVDETALQRQFPVLFAVVDNSGATLPCALVK